MSDTDIQIIRERILKNELRLCEVENDVKDIKISLAKVQPLVARMPDIEKKIDTNTVEVKNLNKTIYSIKNNELSHIPKQDWWFWTKVGAATALIVGLAEVLKNLSAIMQYIFG